MSSTYSPDLRIELIGTGDQAGVWGNTTNTNLSTVLENAIAGYTSVSVIAANQALTANYGAADEARYAAIALTTTTGANFAVYAPPASKLYVIYNASIYTATIYNSTVLGNTTAAGTGVTIPAGKVMTIWSDGTNFAQQNTHLISPTIASATLTAPALGTPASGTMTNVTGLPLTTGVTGTLPVANGGTGVTTSTGSGNTVLSNSPTLVSPALGTPASGVMTNVTGLPLASGVTGTLPVSNGGTGVTSSTGSGNNVLSNSPTLVSPALGTPASGNLSNCTFPTLNQNTTGSAASATNATYATSAGSATNASSATNAGYASNAGSASNATYAVSAGSATNASAATNAGYATNAGNGGVTSVNSTTGAVDLASLAAFAKSLSANGYQKFPGGFTVQWATITFTPPDAGSLTVTFPTPFSSACVGVFSTPISAPGVSYAIVVDNVNTTSCRLGLYFTAGTLSCFYMAIGY